MQYGQLLGPPRQVMYMPPGYLTVSTHSALTVVFDLFSAVYFFVDVSCFLDIIPRNYGEIELVGFYAFEFFNSLDCHFTLLGNLHG